jgi:hypothetical protein
VRNCDAPDLSDPYYKVKWILIELKASGLLGLKRFEEANYWGKYL